jgi:hypothetical protein
MRITALAAALAFGLFACLVLSTDAWAAAGPEIRKCSGAGKARCVEQNKANRIAFNQIKNSRFVGARGDGEGVEDVYCASGKFESRSSGAYGVGISKGSSWRISEATVRQGGKRIDAFLKGQGGFEIALTRRGTQWRVGVASLGRILYPGDVVKTDAGAECAAL